MGRYSTTRQKACHQCSYAKAKCDRKPECCSRCTERRLACTYTQQFADDEQVTEPTPQNAQSDSLFMASLASADMSFASLQPPLPDHHLSAQSSKATPLLGHQDDVQSPKALPIHESGIDFQNLELLCPINANEISNRWLSTYIPMPGQVVKNYSSATRILIHRVLKSYTGIAIHGRDIPPFVHSAQLATTDFSPLLTCLSLVRGFDDGLGRSGIATSAMIECQMDSLHQAHLAYGETDKLAAFQAYLIYVMVLFFRESANAVFLRRAMMNLQEIACESSRDGLVCVAEQCSFRSRWEAWIVAEAKRRTLYTMYLFDSILSAQDGLPTYIGTELRGLPAPMGQRLWSARSRQDWEKAHTIHLAGWTNGSLRIDELWPMPDTMDEAGVAERRKRVDYWLESVDAYGMMLYAVTSCTHGT